MKTFSSKFVPSARSEKARGRRRSKKFWGKTKNGMKSRTVSSLTFTRSLFSERRKGADDDDDDDDAVGESV